MINDANLGTKLATIFIERTGNSFEHFFKANREKLIWFLMKISNNGMESEEVADEAFIKAFYDIEKYDNDKAQFPTWLFTIARNIMIQRMKRGSFFESIEEDHDGATIADYLVQKESANEEGELVTAKKIELIKEEIGGLPHKYSLVLTMREVDGLSYEEISEYLEININTVKSQIRHGRKLLTDRLKGVFTELEEYGVR